MTKIFYSFLLIIFSLNSIQSITITDININKIQKKLVSGDFYAILLNGTSANNPTGLSNGFGYGYKLNFEDRRIAEVDLTVGTGMGNIWTTEANLRLGQQFFFLGFNQRFYGTFIYSYKLDNYLKYDDTIGHGNGLGFSFSTNVSDNFNIGIEYKYYLMESTTTDYVSDSINFSVKYFFKD